MNTVPPDYKSSALPLGHARLVPQDPLNRLLQFLFLIYLLVTSYCFIIVAVVIVLGLGAFFLLCVFSKTIEPLNLRPYENCHPIKEINASTPCSQTQISTPRHIFVDLNLAKMCNEMCQKLVQSLNSPFFPPPIGAETGRAKRESRITCMRMLRTSQSKINRSQPRCWRQCVSFSARALKKKHFL